MPPRVFAVGVVDVTLDQETHEAFFGRDIQVFEVDHLEVTVLGKVLVDVEDVGDPAAHPGGEVPPATAENHYSPAGHVFTAVVPDTFNDGHSPAVAHGETLAGDTTDEHLATCRPIQDHVADNDVLLG